MHCTFLSRAHVLGIPGIPGMPAGKDSVLGEFLGDLLWRNLARICKGHGREPSTRYSRTREERNVQVDCRVYCLLFNPTLPD